MSERELELLMAQVRRVFCSLMMPSSLNIEQEELALALDDARSQCDEEKAKTVAAELARSAEQVR